MKPDAPILRVWGLAIAAGLVPLFLGPALAAESERVESAAQTPRPGVVSTSFVLKWEHIQVPATVNGQTMNLVLDTGASHVALSSQAAERVKLPKARDVVFETVATGGNTGWMGLANSVAVTTAVAHEVPTFVVPVPTVFSADGFLGLSYLRQFVFRIDYPGRTLSLAPGQKGIVPEGDRGVSLRVEGQWISIRGEVDGHPARLVVDTGASQGLMLESWFVEQHRLRESYPRRLKIATGLDIAGLTRGELVRMKSLRLGTTEFRDLEVEWVHSDSARQNEIAGTIGYGVLSRLDLVFDLDAGRMWMTPNAEFSRAAEPAAAARSGLMCLPSWEIVDVAPDSPASEAGIRVGDRLTSVEGRPVKEVPYLELRRLLRSKPGTRIQLEVQTGSEPAREAVLVLRDLI